MERGVAKPADTRTEGMDGGDRHGDSAVAGAMAQWASLTEQTEYDYTPATAPPPAAAGQMRPRHEEEARGRFGPGAW
jgi:phage FluMu gp28-like protein